MKTIRMRFASEEEGEPVLALLPEGACISRMGVLVDLGDPVQDAEGDWHHAVVELPGWHADALVEDDVDEAPFEAFRVYPVHPMHTFE